MLDDAQYQKNKYGSNMMHQSALDNSLINNTSHYGIKTNVNSPSNNLQ